MWAAGDVGSEIINASGAEAQAQGSVLDGLAQALAQEITIDRGRVTQSNFHDYPLLRLTQAPPVEVHWLKTDKWIEGAGEEAIPDVTCAIYNAIYKVTGKRIRNVPLKNHDLSWGGGQTA